MCAWGTRYVSLGNKLDYQSQGLRYIRHQVDNQFLKIMCRRQENWSSTRRHLCVLTRFHQSAWTFSATVARQTILYFTCVLGAHDLLAGSSLFLGTNPCMSGIPHKTWSFGDALIQLNRNHGLVHVKVTRILYTFSSFHHINFKNWPLLIISLIILVTLKWSMLVVLMLWLIEVKMLPGFNRFYTLTWNNRDLLQKIHCFCVVIRTRWGLKCLTLASYLQFKKYDQ